MSDRPALKVLQLLTSTRWAITREALERMVAIAERDSDKLMAMLEARAAVVGSMQQRAGDDDDDGVDFVEPLEDAPRRWALLSRPATSHPQSETLGVRDGVAIVSVVGPLCRYASWFQEICGMSSYQLLAEDFRIAMDDPAVRAVMIHLDSPGGETNGCAELAAMIHARRGEKPIVAMVSDGAASAAYWIAAACDEIVVSPSAYVGSIGVYFEIHDFSAAEAAAGIKRWRIVSSVSPNKVPDPADAAGKAVLQREVDEFADAFVEAAASYRGMTVEALIGAGDGGAVSIGRHAVASGLADRVSTTEAMLAELAVRATTPSTTPRGARGAAQESAMPKQQKPAVPVASASDDPSKDKDEEARRAEEKEKEEEAARRAAENGDGPADDEQDEAEAEYDEDEDEAEAEEETDEEKQATRAFAARHAAMVKRIRRNARIGARKAERSRVAAVIALAPKAIAPALRSALESGQSEGAAAKAFLQASQKSGTTVLAAMASAEATLVAPVHGDTTPTAEKDGAATLSLLEQYSPKQRRRAGARLN